jgi:hypothetical protein
LATPCEVLHTVKVDLDGTILSNTTRPSCRELLVELVANRAEYGRRVEPRKLQGHQMITALTARKSQSSYLKPGRLPDLLAAIQAMAISPRYRQLPEGWADLISGDETKASHWQSVFDEHPEFFRASSKHPGQYALIWRTAGGSRYHRREGRILEYSEIIELSEEERVNSFHVLPCRKGRSRLCWLRR